MNICLTILSLASLIFPFVGANSTHNMNGSTAENLSAQSAGKPPMFVLQVGIGKYLDTKRLAVLRGVRTDIEKMGEMLRGERYNVPAGNIHTLLDEQAKKARIFDEFETHLIGNARSYFQKTKRRDAVAVFQFSGHGSRVNDAAPFDEADGKDETFVTYESFDAPGKNFDITDDEIYELTERLRKYTDNIVYILDSCHSGSATRSTDDVRRAPEQTSQPISLLKPQNTRDAASEAKSEKDNAQTDLLPASDDYIVISAAQANELAGQKYVFETEASQTPVVFGNLTYYLLEELRNARADTTYRQMMENVRQKVAADTKNTQIPQIEGDDKRFVFGGIGQREDNFVKIADVKGKQITVEAGAMQGVGVGTILAVYDKNQKRFGDAAATGKIGVARVTSAMMNRAVAVFNGQKTVTKEDRAVIVAPELGAQKLKVLLDGEDQTKISAEDKARIQLLRQKFTAKAGEQNARGVEIAATGKWNDKPARWDVALLKDNFAKVFPHKSTAVPSEDGAKLNADTPVFYLAGRDFVPVFGFYVEAERKNAVERIEKALVHLAHQQMVRAIGNQKSPLRGQITLTPFRFDLADETGENPCGADGKLLIKGKSDAVLNGAKTAYAFDQNEKFGLQISNLSKRDLYILLLNVGNDGSVKIVAPRKIAGESNQGIRLAAGAKKTISGESCRDGFLSTSAPAGIETYKIIASTEPLKRADFEFLEITAVTKDKQSEASPESQSDWTTAEIDFEISSSHRNPQ